MFFKLLENVLLDVIMSYLYIGGKVVQSFSFYFLFSLRWLPQWLTNTVFWPSHDTESGF